MMYPFLTLDDQTEIVHSEMRSDGSVKVYIEKPDSKDGFHFPIPAQPVAHRAARREPRQQAVDEHRVGQDSQKPAGCHENVVQKRRNHNFLLNQKRRSTS